MKAELSVSLSIFSPNKAFCTMNAYLKSVNWEKYKVFNIQFQEIESINSSNFEKFMQYMSKCIALVLGNPYTYILLPSFISTFKGNAKVSIASLAKFFAIWHRCLMLR